MRLAGRVGRVRHDQGARASCAAASARCRIAPASPPKSARCAADSASEDPRFPPVTADELPDLSLEISVLGPLEEIEARPGAFTIGVHGLVVEQGVRRGLLLAAGRDRVGLGRRTVPASDLRQGGSSSRRLAERRPGVPVRGGSVRRLMPRLGAHLSIAGGLPRAVDRAVASRCEALQIFTKSVGQWRARVLPPDEIVLFRRRVAETRHRAGRGAQQLSDQHRCRGAAAARAVARGARRGIRPRRRRSACSGSSCTPARSRPAASRRGCG